MALVLLPLAATRHGRCGETGLAAKGPAGEAQVLAQVLQPVHPATPAVRRLVAGA
jgi:hypothetical protein